MRKYHLILLALAAVYFSWNHFGGGSGIAGLSSPADTILEDAYQENRSGVQVSGEGTVTRILSDDNEGSRHQRFILRLGTGQTLLVAHNIDLAPRVESLEQGDTVEFNGVYEWNAKGGVIHWTHDDPDGSHQPGWLKHEGRTYR